MNYLRHAIKRFFPLLALLAALIFVKAKIGQAAYIPSESMKPTINAHDVLIIDKTVSPDKLERGNIVVFRSPSGSRMHRILIKRLIGLPGDRIEIRWGALYRNGKKVEETYIKEPMTYRMQEIVVPKGKYFFLGDNRNVSNDSHVWPNPFVDRDDIIGRAVFRIFPFDQMRGM